MSNTVRLPKTLPPPTRNGREIERLWATWIEILVASYLVMFKTLSVSVSVSM